MPIMVRGTDGEMKEISDRVSWIVHCPPGDQNFKDCLGEATADEIEEALDIMGCMEQKKTAIAACERELRKKRKEIRDAHEERKESLFVMLKQTRHDDVIFEAVYGEGETGEH